MSAGNGPQRVEGKKTGRVRGRVLTKINLHSVAVLMTLATVVGLGTGFAAVLFIKGIAALTYFCFVQGLPQILAPLGRFWIVLIPVLGALIAGPLIAFWAVEAKGHGVPEVLTAISTKGGRIRPRVALVKSVASVFCIGSGGSAGREGPIVQVGAALGSTAAQVLGLSTERMITLVACGAAAGISATFNAPIAGVVFAMEVILGEFTTHYFGMVVISSVAASVVSRHFLGTNPAFTVPSYSLVSASELPFYAVLGALAALVGWGFVGILYYAEERFDVWHSAAAFKPAAGAVMVGLIALLYPQALGTGLPIIGQALQGTLPTALMLALVFAKLFATTFTLGSGNSGGVFSPSLFMGAMLGGAFGALVHAAFPGFTGDVGAYALVGMAAVFSAAAHAPLTASLIVFEMSGDYRLILPLMITVGLSTLISQRLRGESIYTLKLARRNIPLERDRDIDIMRGLTVGEVMTRDPDVIRGDATLQALSEALMQTRHHGFPVLDREKRLVGVVTYDDLRQATANGTSPDRTVADITRRDVARVSPRDTLSKALMIMSERELGRLPVVDPDDPSRLVGLLRRADIVRAYRRALLRKLELQQARESLALGHLTHTEVFQILLTAEMAAVGQRLRDLYLPPQVLIISVRRGPEVLIPHGETLLQDGDVVIALTHPEAMDELRKALVRGEKIPERPPEAEPAPAKPVVSGGERDRSRP
jgi:chloride channel protein, CIC family